MFKLIHLSDLHFHGGQSLKNENHTHSIKHLVGIEGIIKKEWQGTDRLIISGDISDFGDDNGLLLARQWIYNSLEIGDKKRTSIGIPEAEHEKIKIIPGNHDAWNSKTKTGKTLDRRQKSLENFNHVFPENSFDEKFACNYEWISEDGGGLFIVYLDSSYLGDTEMESEIPDLKFIDKIAKGKISKEQSEHVLELFDKGTRGRLKYNDVNIPKFEFQSSLKILVMHHYLFEPYGYKMDPFLKINDRNTTFRNIALADFDVLLCGHKHVSDFKGYQYAHYFNRRTKFRYLMNYFRRLIGVHSLPMQLKDEKGKKFTKIYTWLLELVMIKKYSKNLDNEDIKDSQLLQNMTGVLIESLDEPETFEKNFRDFITSHLPTAFDDHVLDENEIREIMKRVRIDLSDEERKTIKRLGKKIKKVISELDSRQFLQIMAGSSCKNSATEKNRSFNIYEVERKDFGYHFRSKKYNWDKGQNSFSEEPVINVFEFRNGNRPLH